MRVRRSHERRMALIRAVEIIRIITLTGQETEIFLAQDAVANAAIRHGFTPCS